MLAWMQSVMACLFLHPETHWVGGVVVLVMCQWVKMDPPPAQCVSDWEDGVNLYDITVTSQSQHTVAAFPECLPAKTSSSRFFRSSCSVEI